MFSINEETCIADKLSKYVFDYIKNTTFGDSFHDDLSKSIISNH